MTLEEVEKVLGKPNEEVVGQSGKKIEMWMYSHVDAIGRVTSRSVSLLFDTDGKLIRTLQRSQGDTRPDAP